MVDSRPRCRERGGRTENRDKSKADGLDWRAVAFVASDKGHVERVLRERGAVIDPDALEHLRGLPETFREWRDAQKAVAADEPMRRAA